MKGVPEGNVRVAYGGGTTPTYYPRSAMDLWLQDLFTNPGALAQVLINTYFPQKLMDQTYGTGLSPVSGMTPTAPTSPANPVNADRTVVPMNIIDALKWYTQER